jgi:hypothetical protein
MRNAIHSIYKKTAEAVLPPLATSQFEEKKVSKWYDARLPHHHHQQQLITADFARICRCLRLRSLWLLETT